VGGGSVTTPYFGIRDDDDYCLPNNLATVYPHIKDSNLAFVGTDIYIKKQCLILKTPFRIWAIPTPFSRTRRKRYSPSSTDAISMMYSDSQQMPVHNCSGLHQTPIFQEVGGYRGDMYYACDYELVCRYVATGRLMENIPIPTYIYSLRGGDNFSMVNYHRQMAGAQIARAINHLPEIKL